MSRSPAISGKATAMKSLKEKCSSRVQSARENGENEIGGFSTITVLLADGAAGNKVLHKGGETWPPEILFQDRFGMKDTHVTQQRGGVDGVE